MQSEVSSPAGEVSFNERVHQIVFKEQNRSRIALISVSLSLFLLSLLLICLMPGPPDRDRYSDQLVERRVIQVLSIALLLICPLAVVGVCAKHPAVSNAILTFVAGVGSGCVCAISFAMILANILFGFLDLIRGRYRLNFLEMISINILMIALTLIAYFQTSLSWDVYSLYVEKERNASVNTSVRSGAQLVIGGGDTNGRTPRSSKTSGSYDLNSGSYDFY